jgi:hypothetical protein
MTTLSRKTKIMKRNLLTLLVPVLLLSACSDDFTLLSPVSERNTGSYYQSQSDFEVALNGAYDALQSSGTFGMNYILFMEMRADNAANGGGATGLAATLEALDTFTEIATANELRNSWAASYAGIARANAIISRIDDATFTSETVRSRIKGEALFIRALLYYHLSVVFGNIPSQFEEATSPSVEINQVPASEIYAQLELDLAEARGLLPETYAAADRGRATRHAAAALLGRIYLTNGKASSAVEPLRSVVTSGQHQLLASYASIWGPANEFNKESIFEVQFVKGGLGEGSPYTDMFTPNGLAGGVGGGGAPQDVTADLVNAYEPGDARFGATLDVTNPDNPWVKKYDSTPFAALDSDVNWMEIRYAEVLLNLAEALGEGNEAYGLINQVRARAGLDPISAGTSGTFASKLLQERRVEFAFENKRWADLLRFGVAKSVMSAHLGIPQSSVKLLFPIPQSQIDVAPDRMTQNSEH